MLAQSLQTVLRQPQPAALVALQEALLMEVAPSPERDSALELVRHFYRYQIDLQTMLTARQYSELASWLDVTAVGLVAFEELIRGTASSLRDLLIATASEGAMVLGSRQYIKSWAVARRCGGSPSKPSPIWRRPCVWRPCAAPCRRASARPPTAPGPWSWVACFRHCC